MNENEIRAALEAVRKNANDPTVTVGDVVFCGGVYATVTEVREWTPGTHDASPIRNDWTAVQVVTDTGARWRGVEPVAPQSGYTHCACRDCMDTTVSSDMSKSELCSECKNAGCEPAMRVGGMDLGGECQRDDAYGEV